MNFGLSEAIHEEFRRVFADFPEIERVLIFGSRAKGGYRDGSDIDLAVLAPAMMDSRFTELWQAVDDLPLVFKVDLLHWDRLGNLALRDRIVQEGRPFFTPGRP